MVVLKLTTAQQKPLDKDDEESKKETQQLIKLNHEIQLATATIRSVVESEDVAVFLGSTRAGKSTLINYLIGNLLEAEKVSKYSPFILKISEKSLGPKIGIGTTSETVQPSRWISYKLPGLALWDAPGFDDNRGVVQDISNAFYIKELLSNVKSAKIILVTDFNDIAGSNNIKPFLSLMQSVETIFGDKMKVCLSSIGVIFTMVPKELHGNIVTKELVKEILKERFINTSIAISQNIKAFINGLIDDTARFGFFKKQLKDKVVLADLDSGIVEAIKHVGVINKIILKSISPSISQDSKVFLFTKQNQLCSLDTFKELLTGLETVYLSLLSELEDKIKTENDQEQLKDISKELSKIEGKIEELTVGNDKSLHKQLMSIMVIFPENKPLISELKMLEKATILEFIDGVLNLKHNDIFSSELVKIKSTIMLKIQKNNLAVKEKLGLLTHQQVEEMKQKIQEKHGEESEYLRKKIAELEEHNERIEKSMKFFTKVGLAIDTVLENVKIPTDSCNIL